MKNLIWLVGASLMGSLFMGSPLLHAKPPREGKKYFDAKWKPVESSEKAAYYKLYERVGSDEYQVTSCTITDQKLEAKTYRYGYQGVLLISRKWWPTGQLKYEVHHYQGQFMTYDGAVDAYYLTGILRRHDVYRAGKLLTGACYTQQGQPEPYYPFSASPVLQDSLGLHVRMRQTRRPNVRVEPEKEVMVYFTVAADGSVRNVTLDKGLRTATDSAALVLVQALPRFSAGYTEGEPTEMSISVPVKFQK